MLDDDGPTHLGELAPWEDVTPSSMNFEHGGGPIHLESMPYRVPASARENAGPLRWAAVLALGVAVGGIALLLALTGGSDGGLHRRGRHDGGRGHDGAADDHRDDGGRPRRPRPRPRPSRCRRR